MHLRHTLACCLACAGVVACVEPSGPPPPTFEWSGEWIDVHGYDVKPEDTCAGTLDYLDAYAGALSTEFGVNEHLGLYRWYDPETFAEHDPCRRDVLGCTGLNGIFTKRIPFEHELVHLANDQIQLCPLLLAEGLAEYYDTLGSTPDNRDLGPLLADPNVYPFPDYPLAGAFVAFLVDTYGLNAVLEVCEHSGASADAQSLVEAFDTVLGATTAEIETGFADYGCNYETYRSKLYECGLEPAAVVGPDNLGPDAVVIDLNLDCADPRTVGPRNDEIWTLETVRVTDDGIYIILIETQPEATNTGLEVMECATCLDTPRRHSYDLSVAPVVGPIELRAGDHFLRLSGPPGSSLSAQITLQALP